MNRGAIRAKEAYALGKMLEHSSWARGEKRLPRNITPSDFDMVFDNYGSILYCELTTSLEEWTQTDIGQRGAYMAAVWKGERHCAALCRHTVKLEDGRDIDTRNDICSFQPLIFQWGDFRVGQVVRGNKAWQDFVFEWYRNPHALRGAVFENSELFQKGRGIWA